MQYSIYLFILYRCIFSFLVWQVWKNSSNNFLENSLSSCILSNFSSHGPEGKFRFWTSCWIVGGRTLNKGYQLTPFDGIPGILWYSKKNFYRFVIRDFKFSATEIGILLPGGNPSLYWELAIEHMDETSDISESGKFWGKWLKARDVGDRGDLGEFGAVSDSKVDELDFFRSLSIRLPHIMLERLEWLDRRTSPSIELEKKWHEKRIKLSGISLSIFDRCTDLFTQKCTFHEIVIQKETRGSWVS